MPLSGEAGSGKLDLRPVASLLPHEETIPSQVDKLIEQMRRDEVQKDPLIVDYESGAVLDGMHRIEALKSMGAESAVCYLVDYSSRSIALERWLRVYGKPSRPSSQDATQHMLEGIGVDKKVTLKEAFDLVDSVKNSLAIVTAGACYIPREPSKNLSGVLTYVRKVDDASGALGWKVSFIIEDEIDVVMQDANNLVLLTPRINKQEVLDAARSGRLFPCKTTRHIVDPRPVGVNFPMTELMKSSPPRPVLEKLAKEGRRAILPPNSFYEGRRYKERLLVLSVL